MSNKNDELANYNVNHYIEEDSLIGINKKFELNKNDTGEMHLSKYLQLLIDKKGKLIGYRIDHISEIVGLKRKQNN